MKVKTVKTIDGACRGIGDVNGFTASMRDELLVIEGSVQSVLSHDRDRNDQMVDASIAKVKAQVKALVGEDIVPVERSLEEMDGFIRLSVAFAAKDVFTEEEVAA